MLRHTKLFSNPTLVSSLMVLLSIPAISAQEIRAQDSPASTRAQDDRSGAVQEYRLGASDIVEVFVWKEPELSRTITVRPDGRISLPLAGELEAEGATPHELESQITAGLREYIDQPLVTVIVKEINSPTISVLGEVQRPGRYVIPQRTTVLDAIAMSGGFTEFAHRGRVMVIRRTDDAGTERLRVPVKRLLQRGGTPFFLSPGDTVHVD